MKKMFMVFMMATLLIGLTATAQSFSLGENYTITNSEVKFYLVDWDTTQFNGQIIMTASTLGASIAGLQYSLDGNSWNSFSGTGNTGTVSITIAALTLPHTQLMYLKYGSDTIADSMIFQSYSGSSGIYTAPAHLSLFTGLVVNFDSSQWMKITFASNALNDKFAPVPVPPSIWLMGAGLVGLIGLRRRLKG